jgi:hypothetical protein
MSEGSATMFGGQVENTVKHYLPVITFFLFMHLEQSVTQRIMETGGM